MTSLRRRLRLARRLAWYAVAVVLVVTALVAGIVSQLLPLAERHPERIAQWLGERAGRPVAFDGLQTAWTRRGPLLRLDGLRIGDGANAVRIGEAEILVAQYAGLLPGRSFTELRLRGLQLTLERDDAGRWGVRGLPGEGTGDGDPFAALEGLGELQVFGGRLTIHAPSLGIEATLPKADLRLSVNGPRLRAAARAWMHAEAAPIDVALDIDRHDGNGRAHAAMLDADLAPWSPLLRLGGIAVDGGHGRAQAWVTLGDHRVSELIVDAALTDVGLLGAPLAGHDDAPRLAFPEVTAKLRMRGDESGWRIDAPRLRVGGAGKVQVLDGLTLAAGERRALLAERIDAGPLVAVLALSDRLDDGLRTWLLAARPDAVLHAVRIVGDEGGHAQASARIEVLSFATVGDAPGVAGLAGELQGDADGFAFSFDPQARFRFDWPSGFGPPHEVLLTGGIAGWRDGGGLRVEAPALRIEGDEYGVDVRGGMWFQSDGSLPMIDLAARVHEAQVPVAKRFWVRHLMPEAALHWLDTALVGGSVRNGRAVVSGELDDWPFSTLQGKQARGIFRAEAELVGAEVKFQPDWPAAERIDAEVAFVNDGFEVHGRAEIAGVQVSSLDARLAHYGEAELKVRASAATGTGPLLALLRQSPLHGEHGETLDSIVASGPAVVGFALNLPMQEGARPPTVAGTVELRGAKLADPRWEVAFEDVRGKARYDHHGFDSGDLAVLHDGQPGTLSLRAGNGHVHDPAQAFEAVLDAPLDAATLLARAPDMAWLTPYITGRSPWRMQVTLPVAAAARAQSVPRLQLSSDLVGTAMTLPQPMSKPAADALPTTVQTALPLEDGEISVAFGQRLALRARSAHGRTGVRVELGAGQVALAPPVHGLAVSGRTRALDMIEWAGFAAGGDGDGLPLQDVDLLVDQLRLPGGRFADTRVRAAPVDGGTRVGFEGPAIAGTLHLPDAHGEAIVGGFERLHWRLPEATATGTQAQAAAEDEVDPARVPPLQLDVRDLRVGEMALGAVSLRTRPKANGLDIERLQARAPKQAIDVSGEWSGRGAQAHTRLDLKIESEDFGALLAAAGFGRQVDGGRATLRFGAHWPGSPAGFELGALEGELDVLIRDGRLSDVEPGAGRLLGLFSVAQLPRRLLLDFSDFFASGFAFNRIAGQAMFSDGLARTEGMVIDGPAAEIRIVGRSDLRAQTHDQVIEVHPRTGNLLPAVGAAVGGPVGAAVGAVANAVLRKPLGEMNARTYRVSGPWKDPKVDVAEHGASRSTNDPGEHSR